MEEYPMNIPDRICAELEEKNRVLNEYVRDREDMGDKEGVIQVRIHQLALCKVLVNVHNRNPFMLVQAHTNLGESYLSSKYYEQALEHLTSALKLNGSLFNSIEDTKPFHTHILTLLGKCYLEAGGTEDAFGLLEKALKMNKSLLGEDHLSNSSIYHAMAQAYSKKKDHSRALDCLTTMWELHEATFGMKHESIPPIYEEMGKVYYKQKDIPNAIDLYKRAVNLMMDMDMNTDKAAEIAVTLSQWLQESANYPEALDALRSAEQVYEYNHGLIDKRTAKVKRSICMLLLKAGEYNEALEECLELEEIDRSLHGENSQQYAKNLKVIGTVLMILKRYKDAYAYFNKALGIFKRFKGTQKTIKEIKQKLNSINTGLRENPELYDTKKSTEENPEEAEDKDSNKSV